MSRGRKVYTFGDIGVVDVVNDRLPILDMSQSGDARDKLISPAALVSGLSASLDSFITTGQTGDFYPRSNPSGFISGQDLSSYSTISYTTGVSGHLQEQISTLNSATGDYYPRSNPSGFISGDFSLYGTLVYINTISGNLQSGIDNFAPDIIFQKVSGKAALEVFYTGSSLGFLQLSAAPI